MRQSILSTKSLNRRNNKIQSLLDDPSASNEDLRALLESTKLMNNAIIENETVRTEFIRDDTAFKTLKKYAFKGFATNLSGHEMAGIVMSLRSVIGNLTDVNKKNQSIASLDRVDQLFQGFSSLSSDCGFYLTLDFLKQKVSEFSFRDYSNGTIQIDDSCNAIDESKIFISKMVFVGVIFNLLSNAQYFSNSDMSEDGTMPTRVLISFDGTSLFVSDNGEGVPDSEMLNLFNFGHSTRTNGHGMGLALCKEFAQSQRADLTYDLNSDAPTLSGACFKFLLLPS